jgi:hypothetical protein
MSMLYKGVPLRARAPCGDAASCSGEEPRLSGCVVAGVRTAARATAFTGAGRASARTAARATASAGARITSAGSVGGPTGQAQYSNGLTG